MRCLVLISEDMTQQQVIESARACARVSESVSQ
jgi:hypothetical protein